MHGQLYLAVFHIYGSRIHCSLVVKGNIYDPVNNYSYVEDTKVSVSIKNKCQQMHIKRDISL